jgi:hypothetical protein
LKVKGGKEGQNPTDYIPSKAALRLLEALLDPASRLKTVTAVCRIAKIHRDTYYELFKKVGFRNLYREISMDMIKYHIGPLVNALICEAVRGSYQHIKMALEIAGIYTEKKRVNVPELEGFGERLARAIERVKKARQEGK